MDDKNAAHGWPVPNAVGYIEDAERLRGLAAEAQTPEARLELEHLARLYERLADSSLLYPEGDGAAISAEALSGAVT